MGESYKLQPRRRFGCVPWLLTAIGILLLGVSIVLPSMGRAREPAKRVMCSNNLRDIALALKAYADANGGHLPPELGTLLRTQEITANVFVCPSSSHERAVGTLDEQATSLAAGKHLSYVYLGAGHDLGTVPPGFVLAYDEPANHDNKPRDGGSNFVFADLRARYIPHAQPVIDQLRAGQNPPVVPPEP
jgi:hypothetical protein